MARGWESKAIEAQQDDARAGRATASSALNPEEAARASARATLALARTRALGDLQHACAPAHRAMLEAAIADLDRKLQQLDGCEGPT